MFSSRVALAVLAATLSALGTARSQGPRSDSIPLSEHPRPDFERAEWRNLNGRWDFALDARDEGERSGWARESRRISSGTTFSQTPRLSSSLASFSRAKQQAVG